MTQEPALLYRFEATDPNAGLWYNEFGQYVFERNGLNRVQNHKHLDMPMGYDERYRRGGRNWFSATQLRSDMSYWFNITDVPKMLDLGYRLWQYVATEYVHYEFETTFIKETCIERNILNPYTPWMKPIDGPDNIWRSLDPDSAHYEPVQ